jgi:endo-alpha-1,4-polygalactosaminidase (GH114 family)
VNNYTVKWDAKFYFETTLIIGKDGYLKPQELTIHIKQDINGGEQSQRLGMVSIPVHEFAGLDTRTERYLLQNAKSNSILKFTFEMILIEGNDNKFTVRNEPRISIYTTNMASTSDQNASARVSSILSRIRVLIA